MQKHYKSYLYAILLLVGIGTAMLGNAQSKVDSFQNLLAKAKTDTEKVTRLNQIADVYVRSGQDSVALITLHNSLKLAKPINDPKGLADCYLYTGALYKNEGNNDTSEYFMKLALVYYIKQAPSKPLSRIYKNLGDVYREGSKFPEAMDAYTKDIANATTLKDSLDLMYGYYDMALVYDMSDQFDMAREQCLKSIDVALKLKQYRSATGSYNVVGSTYAKQANSAAALQSYFTALDLIEKYVHQDDAAAITEVNLGNVYNELKDSTNSMKYYRDALQKFTKLGNKQGQAQVIGNMGNCYMNFKDLKRSEECEIKSMQIIEQLGEKYYVGLAYNNVAEFYDSAKQYDKAEQYYNKAFAIQNSIGDKEGMVYSLSGMSKLYENLKDLPKAEEYERQAFNIATQINLEGQVRDQSLRLSRIYEKLHQPDKALYYYKLFVIAKDSLDNKAQARKFISTELNHEYEQKQQVAKLEDEKQKAIAKEREQREAVIRKVYLGAIIIVLSLMVLLIRNLLRIRKSRQIISDQKQEVESQKLMVDQKNKDITDSIKYASRIQRALITTEEYIGRHVKEHFVFFKPRDIVSGDFYWAYLAPPQPDSTSGSFYLACCDCTGHGVPGAFMSLLNISMLNETIIEREVQSPELVLNDIRDSIIMALNPEKSDTESKDGMDCSLAAIDFANKRMTIACANNPAWVIRNGECLEIDADKMPVGIQHGEQKTFTLHNIELKQGDCIYLFTDGYADQFGGPKGKKFKYQQMKELVMANAQKPMNEQKMILEKAFTGWMGNLEQIDDVLVIGIKV